MRSFTERRFWRIVGALVAVVAWPALFMAGPAIAQDAVPSPVILGPGSTLQIPGELLASDCERDNVTRDQLLTPTKSSKGVFRFAKGIDMPLSRNVRLATGLLPTTNIAAQAGSIDQTVSANAFTNANNRALLAERHRERPFRVSSIWPACSSR